MADYSSTDEILDGILRKLGEPTDGTSDQEADALTELSSFYIQLVGGGKLLDIEIGILWDWAKEKDPSTLELLPMVDTGTVALTKGSTSGTFSVAPAASTTDYWLKLENREEWFRIAAHTAAMTSLTLDANYTGDTGAALNFKAIKTDYDLSTGVIRIGSPIKVYRGAARDIKGLDPSRFRRDYPRDSLYLGTPTHFTQVKEVDGLITVRFNAYVDTETRAEYESVKVPTVLTDSSGSIPIIPLEYRKLLMHGPVYSMMVDRGDSRADFHFSEAQKILQSMFAAQMKEVQQTNPGYGRLNTREGDVVPRRETLVGDITVL